MRKFTIGLMKFLFYFILLFVVPITILCRYDNLDAGYSSNHNIISLQTKSFYDDLDLLFIGNSYCYSSIDTRVLDSLGINSFNLGIATAGVDFYDLMINDYFNEINRNPERVLILVSPTTFSSKSDNFSLYPIHRYLDTPKSHLEVAFRYNKFDELLPMYRSSIDKCWTNVFESQKSIRKKIRFNNKGFFPSELVVDNTVILNDEKLYQPFKFEKFNESKVKDLRALAKEIENKGSQVVFFELPTHKLTDYFSTNYLKKYDLGLSLLSKDYSLISIEENLFEAKHFRNIDHMNSKGAQIATLELHKLIQFQELKLCE